MRLQNLELNRVLRAVLIITSIGIVLSFGACYCYLISELLDEVDPQADISEQQRQLQQRAPEIIEDVLTNPPPGLNLLFLGQLGVLCCCPSGRAIGLPAQRRRPIRQVVMGWQPASACW